MEILFSFLNWTSSFSHVDEESGSKMDVHNLATVMTPNILYSNSKNPGMDDSFLAIEAVTSLIEYNDTMCEVSNAPTIQYWRIRLTTSTRFPKIFNKSSITTLRSSLAVAM